MQLENTLVGCLWIVDCIVVVGDCVQVAAGSSKLLQVGAGCLQMIVFVFSFGTLLSAFSR